MFLRGAGAGLSHHLAPVGPDVAQVDLLLALAWHDGVEQLLLALGEAGILGAALLAAGGDATHVAGGRLPGLRAARRGDLAAGPVPDPIHFDQLLGLGPSALSKHVLVAALHLADRGAIELPPRSIRVLLLRLDGRLGDHIALAPGALILALLLVTGGVVIQIHGQLLVAAGIVQAFGPGQLEAWLVATVLGATDRHIALGWLVLFALHRLQTPPPHRHLVGVVHPGPLDGQRSHSVPHQQRALDGLQQPHLFQLNLTGILNGNQNGSLDFTRQRCSACSPLGLWLVNEPETKWKWLRPLTFGSPAYLGTTYV